MYRISMGRVWWAECEWLKVVIEYGGTFIECAIVTISYDDVTVIHLSPIKMWNKVAAITRLELAPSLIKL